MTVNEQSVLPIEYYISNSVHITARWMKHLICKSYHAINMYTQMCRHSIEGRVLYWHGTWYCLLQPVYTNSWFHLIKFKMSKIHYTEQKMLVPRSCVLAKLPLPQNIIHFSQYTCIP